MVKRIIRLFVIFAVLVSLVLGYFYYQNYIRAGVATQGNESHIFIPKNADAETVFNLLNDQQLLTAPQQFTYLMEIKKYEGNKIVPGKYKIEEGWSNNQLINHLRFGNGRLDSRIQFHNVQTIAQLSGMITRELLLDSAEVVRYLSQPENLQKYGFNENTMLSMFIPNTYFVDVDISVEELMQRMAKEYKAFWNAERKSKLRQIGLTQSEVVTLASIVYWETKLKKDMPVVAGVYMNRIRVGMPLQADPTLIYILEKMGKGPIKRVYNHHKKLESPYNTYKYKGLPPGPILIPPPVYVDAVLNYKKHDYYYFVAKEDLSGESYFSSTYKQHLIYAARYYKMLKQKGIR